MRRSSIVMVNTSTSGDLDISKCLMDVLLAAAVVIPFSGVLYGMVVFVAFFGGFSIVLFFGGFLIVLGVNFMRKYIWCDMVCVWEKHKINKRKNKKQKTETENQ